MAIFVPRTPEQILRDLLAKVVARTSLSDVQVGSNIFTLLNSMAHEVANTEARLFNLRKSYSLDDATGEDLDARVAELPPVGISRKKRTTAGGAVLRIRRSLSPDYGDITVPAGSLVNKSSDGTTYRLTTGYIHLAGVEYQDDVYVVSTSPGEIGNAGTGEIDTIVSMPDGILAVENVQPINNGLDYESDVSLRARARRYINSLGRTGKSALEFLGTSFVASDNTSFTFAKIFEDPEQPGYSELVVDDGTGLENTGSRETSEREFTIPNSGSQFLTHERPATRPISAASIRVTRDGNAVRLRDGDIISMPERGVVYVKEGVLQVDDVVTLPRIRVHSGLIAELQEEIEGNVNNPSVLTGFRAAGVRVRVVTPLVTDLGIKCNIIVNPQFDKEIIVKNVEEAIVDYVNNIGIGEQLNPSSLTTHLMLTQNIMAANLFVRNSVVPMQAQYPQSAKHVLRTNANIVDVFTTN
jgi:uncharacterized phage protein gp47/JayE